MPKIVSNEEWIAARQALLEEEKALTRARDDLAAKRRRMPWVRVDKPYRFGTPDGTRSLGELFGTHSQLIAMHFMFGPDWDQGCPSCSFWADGYSGLEIHLAHRDTAFVAVSNTSLEKIDSFRERMGWTFPWVSSLGSDFNRDFHVSFTQKELAAGPVEYNYRETSFPATEAPGLSVFHKPDPTRIVHTYSTYSRGLDLMNAAYQLLDLTPKGRDEDGFAYPMAWIRRHDAYD